MKTIKIVCALLTAIFCNACSSSTEPEEFSGKAYSLAIGASINYLLPRMGSM